MRIRTRKAGQEDLADQQRPAADTENRAASPDGLHILVHRLRGVCKQRLARQNARQFHCAALHAGVGEQHGAQRPRTEMRQPLQLAAQRRGGDHGASVDPWLVCTHQLHLPDDGTRTAAHVQRLRLVLARRTPGLRNDTDAEPGPAQLLQPQGQRGWIQQPVHQVRRDVGMQVAPV
jgi:hypothetical protein